MRGWALLAFVVASLLASPAAAHRPFFTQVEAIQLPNGERGEVRLLHGDGILGPIRCAPSSSTTEGVSEPAANGRCLWVCRA